MAFGDYKPLLSEIARSLRILVKQTCNETSSLSPSSATQAAGNPATISAGYRSLSVVKTNGTGTVTITFPDGVTTYILTASGEAFDIKGNLGEYTINAASGGTYKYVAY